MGKVYCSVYNGAGNQLFGYALGLYLSRKYGKQLHIDLTKLNTINALSKTGIKKDTARSYELAQLGFNEPVRQFHPVEFLRKSKLLAPKKYAIADFRNGTMDELNGAQHIYSLGWGDLSVVKKVLPEMKKKFSPGFIVNRETEEILHTIRDKNAVALHVRRTDYLNGKTGNRFGGICTETYYQNAIEHIQKHTDNPYFVVFSDDTEYVKNNLKVPNGIFAGGNPGYVDLYLMSRCNHFILANSTFSFWGAMLNENENKLVCAPEYWYNRPLEKENYIPEAWERIKIS